MTKQAKGRKRGRFLVLPSFQIKFMAYILVFSAFGLVVLYGSNAFYFDRLVSEGREMGLAPDHIYFQFIDQQRSLLNSVFVTVSAIVFGGLVIAGVYLSHRIAGPVYRIQCYLQEFYETGQPGRIKFRDGDFFPEIAELVNALVEHSNTEPAKEASVSAEGQPN